MSPGRIRLVGRGESLISAVAACLPGEGRDLSRSWVVFPERRPAYYLRKHLAVRVGAGFVPPRIFSLDAFVDRVYAERLGRRDRPIDSLDAVALLLDIQRSAPEKLGRLHFLTADHFFPLGLKLYRDLEELEAAGIAGDQSKSVDDFFRASVSGESADLMTDRSKNRLQDLSYFQERFTAAVRESGFSTPACRLRTVAESLDRELFPDVDRFVFAGFFSLNKAEAEIFRRLSGWDDAVLLFHRAAGIESVLEKLGVEAGGEATDAPGPDFSFTRCPDAHGQVFALNAVLREKLSDPSRLDERQVVVLPAAETLFPLYQQTLADLPRERFNISLGYPLTRTPIFSFFERLLQVLQSADADGRVYAPDYVRFVLHPYAKNIRFPGLERRSDLTRILFHAVEEALTEKKGKAFWSLGEIESAAVAGESVERLSRGVEGAPVPAAFLDHLRSIHEALIEPLRTIASVGDFAAKLTGILHFIYENGTARRHYFFHPYAEAFVARLERLAGSLLRTAVFEDREGYFNLFRKVAAAGTVPFFGTPLRGLQVLGFWETRGIPFEEVFLLDVNEDVLPAAGGDESLLPYASRRALGLPTRRDKEREVEHHLDVLLGGARRAHLFFIEGRDRQRSRYVERLLWESRKRDPEKAAETPVGTVRYTPDLRSYRPPEVPKTAEIVEGLRRLTYSAASLDAYLKCPLRFYYRSVLGLKEREGLDEEIEAKDVGILVHRILEEDFKTLVGRPLRPEDFPATRVEKRVEAVFRDIFGENPGGRPYLMTLQTKRRLADYYEKGQAEIVSRCRAEKKDVVVQALEQDVKAGRGPFNLAGRFDRVETRGDEIFVLDYKTGGDEKKLGIRWDRLDLGDRTSWARSVGSLQMPLYAILAGEMFQKPPGEIRARWVMLGTGRITPDIEVSPFEAKAGRKAVTPDERAERFSLAGRLIDALLSEIVDPDVPFKPADEADRVCVYCDYKNLCNRN